MGELKQHPLPMTIDEQIENLKSLGLIIENEEYAKKILDHFDMAEYFDFIGGADMGETRVRKADVIRYVLEQCGLESDNETIGRCVMVGDREHDVLGARECGMECVGVLYGYGDRQEMDACRPALIAETGKDLRDLLLSL